MASHDACDRSQPETPALELRGKERVENPGLRGLIHTGAGIADLEGHVCSGRQLVVWEYSLNVVRVQVPSSRQDHHRAGFTLTDSFRAIDDQVHDKLLRLSRIRL